MPEAPDLQVVKEFLQLRLTGVAIAQARVLRPIVLRSLAAPDFATDVAGRRFTSFWRRGKFLGMGLSPRGQEPGIRSQETGDRGQEARDGRPGVQAGAERLLVINPMLSGGLHYCKPSERVPRKTFIILSLSDGMELRYFDEDQMGMVYYITLAQLPQVPRLAEQGPDVLDEPLAHETFVARLKPFRGEIKGVLTRGAFVSGIGNAYADEVLFAAGLFPFIKSYRLKEPELKRLHQATYSVPSQAVEVLRQRMRQDIHLKIRDFLQVHGKGGQPCPRCGAHITSITANGRLHNYCRHCQPGMLLRR